MGAQTPQIQMFQSDLRDYWAVLKRRWRLILLAFVITVSSTAVYLVRTPRQYEATAMVKIPTSGGGGLAAALGAFLPVGPTSDVATEIEINKGRDIAEKVIRELQLDKKEKNLELDWREVVSEFQKTLKVKQRGVTDLIEITATGDSPEEAKDIANEVADEYIQLSETSSQKLWNGLINQMEAKLERTRADLEESRQSLHDYESEEGIATAFSILLIGAGASKEGYGTQYVVPEVPQAVAQLKAGIMEMEVQLEAMRKSLSEADPKVISLKKQIAASKQKLQQEEKKAIEKYNKQFGLTKVAAEVVFNQQLYSMLISKQEELKAQYIMQNKSPEIIEKAVEPLYPSKPKRKLTLMLGAMLGLLLGIGFAFFLEHLEDTIRTPDDVAQHLGLPVLGVVPRVPKANKAKTPPLVMQSDAKNRAPAEAYRSLRTNLLSSELGNPKKTITVISAGPKEGKSITVANLGVALARAGQNVLLVDADLHRPALHRVFNTDRHKGLSAVLSGELTLDEAIVETGLPNLSILASGAVSRDHSEILGSVQMKEVISRIREQYDIVLFDSTPILGMTDGVVLAAETDGAVMVIKTGEATRKALKMAMAQLEQVGAKICGVVLNNVNVKRDRYYYYYYCPPYEDEEGKRVRKKGGRASRHRAS